jgi:inorganic pyrophosphatase
MACGAFGMHVATYSNFRTTICAKVSLGYAFKTAYRAGVVIGFALVSLSLVVLLLLIQSYKTLLGLDHQSKNQTYYLYLFESIAGFGLGGSTVALFARVGGGIFTKAADLGSDLVGKIESGLPEDSPRNPATIADNVGDNVGDVAGMGADLFGSFAEATCAALVIGGDSLSDTDGVIKLELILFVLLIPTLGLIISILTSALIT